MDRIFIDVRDPFEFNMDHVKGAINIPPNELMAGAKKLKDVPKNTELVLYCRSGSRSNASMSYFKQLGYTNLVNGTNKDQIKAKYGI